MINPNGSIFSTIAIFDALSLVTEVNVNTIYSVALAYITATAEKAPLKRMHLLSR